MAKAKILVVEDDALVRELIEKALGSHGYEVSQAIDGIDGLMKFERDKPDLMIVDMMMPRMDGMTLVRAIKGNQDAKAVPIIFLTAKSDARSMIDGINVGAKYYLTKPFQIEDLVAKIERAI